jgi:hypothetical protein
MSTGGSLAAAVVFVWAGMVVGISFLEAPLKFRAPGVTLRIGLGIGRLVFRALNMCEVGFAALLVVVVVIGSHPSRVAASVGVAVLVLAVQLVVVRPILARRSNRVLAGEDVPRSIAHYWYLGLEVAKLAALVVAGMLILMRR